MHDHHLVQINKLSDRREFLRGIVGHRLEQERIARDRRVARKQQRVAVWRRAGDGFAADHRRGATLVFDDDRLTPVFCKTVRNCARHAVDAATRRIGHDNLDGAGGKILSERGQRKRRRRGNKHAR